MGMRDLVCDIINKNKSHDKKIIEIGIWKGDLSRKIAKSCKFNQLILIDPLSEEVNDFRYSTCDEKPTIMSDDRYRCGKNETIKEFDSWSISLNEFIKKENLTEKVIFVREKSEDVVDNFKDKDFDFIYIDAIHLYENVINDVKNYLPKVKSNGIIFGDDYSRQFPGVINAINDAFKGVDLSIHKKEGVWVHKLTDESRKIIEENILKILEKDNKK
jgi:hypothetical protein